MRVHFCVASLSLLVVCGGFTGCTLTNSAAPSTQAVFLNGSVYGGSLPVTQAHVYLLAANTLSSAGPGIPAGPGQVNAASNASVSLLTSAPNTASDANGDYYVTTGNNGSFTLTGDYSACTPGEQLYLYASGGNAGAGVNAASGMMAVLGACTATFPNANTHVTLNEMSTVAAAYAVAGFASDATHVADDEAVTGNTTAAIAQTGMANAFANAANLVTLATGVPLYNTPGNNGTIPVTTLNTIASLLANCVQTSGPTSPPCVDLFSYTGTPSGADTATAAIRLAQNPAGVPGSSVTPATLLSSLPQNVAYVPVLTTAPNDFSMPIVYASTAFSAPTGVAVDAAGDVWTANYVGNTVSKLTAADAAYTETTLTDPSLNQPNAIAIDTLGGAWVTNSGTASLTKFTGSGTSYSASSYTGGNLVAPEAVAVDGNDNVWVADVSSSAVVEFVGSGTSYAGTQTVGANYPYAVAIDANENVWTGSAASGVATEFTRSGSTYIPTQYANANLGSGYFVALDATGNVWMAGNGNNSLGEFSGASYTGADYTGGGLNAPVALAVDGSGSIWLANGNAGSISKFSNLGVPLSPAATGYTGTSSIPGSTGGPLTGPSGIAVDTSGNVWVSDSSNTLVEFIGAGAPTLAPLATAVHLNKLGARP